MLNPNTGAGLGLDRLVGPAVKIPNHVPTNRAAEMIYIGITVPLNLRRLIRESEGNPTVTIEDEVPLDEGPGGTSPEENGRAGLGATFRSPDAVEEGLTNRPTMASQNINTIRVIIGGVA